MDKKLSSDFVIRDRQAFVANVQRACTKCGGPGANCTIDEEKGTQTCRSCGQVDPYGIEYRTSIHDNYWLLLPKSIGSILHSIKHWWRGTLKDVTKI